MAVLKELKERIASVQSTLKITSAMKMVASAKLLRVQSSMEALSEYERRFSDIVAALVSDPDVEVASPLTLEHGEKRRACLVALASDSSLCGAFNANALREAVSAVRNCSPGDSPGLRCIRWGRRWCRGWGGMRLPAGKSSVALSRPALRCRLVKLTFAWITGIWSGNIPLTESFPLRTG